MLKLPHPHSDDRDVAPRARRRSGWLLAALVLPLVTLPVLGLPVVGIAGAAAAADPYTTPQIDHVSTVVAQSAGTYDSGPTVVIDGHGFGSTPPTVTEAPQLDDTQLGQSALGVQANTRNVHFVDEGFWATDHIGLYPSDDNNCYLTIGKWTDTQVVVMLDDAGITSACSSIGSGDDMSVELWSTDGDGGYGISPGSGAFGIGEAVDVSDLASVNGVDASSGPLTGGTFAADGTADPDGLVTVSGSRLQDASVLWFGDGGYSGGIAVTRCGGGQDPVADACFSEADGKLRANPPAASSGEDKGVYLGVATPGGTSHLNCFTVFTCDGGVFYYQSPSSAFGSFDQDVSLEYPDSSVGFTGGVELGDTSCPGSAPSGGNEITYSISATASSGQVNLSGTPMTSVNKEVVSSLQIPMLMTISEAVNLDLTVSGTISGCAAIPLLGGDIAGIGGGLYMMIGGNLEGSYTFHVTINKGQIRLNAGYTPGGVRGASIVSEDCTDDADEPVPCLETSDEWTASGTVYFSPLWLDIGLDAGPFEFSAGAGISLAGHVQVGSEGSGHEICYGGTYQVTAAADLGFTSFEYSNAGPFWGPFHLAGNSPEMCPLGAIEDNRVATTTVLTAADPVHTHEGTAVAYTALVSPIDSEGTVAFSQDGSPLDECAEVPVTEGAAVCTVAYDGSGRHQVGAAYSGDRTHQDSVAETLAQGITRANQVIAFTLPEQATYGTTEALTAVGGDSGQDVTYVVPRTSARVCRLAYDDTGTPLVSFTGIGTCDVVARQAAGGGFNAAADVTRTVEVGPASQTIEFTAPTGAVTAGNDVLDATATSTTPTYSVDEASADVCGLEDGPDGATTVVYLAAGSCVLSIDAPADDHHSAASASATIDVERAPTLTMLEILPRSFVVTVVPSASMAGFARGALAPAAVDGVVEVTVDDDLVVSAPVVDGTATLPHALATGQDHTVVATYLDDDPDYVGSTTSAGRSDPLLTTSISSEIPARAGWYRTPVTVTTTCTPTTAPLVDSCPAPVVLRTSRVYPQLRRAIRATDGGRATTVVDDIRIDRKAPRVSYTILAHPDPAHPRRPVAIQVTDGLSGVVKQRTTTSTVRTSHGSVVRYETVALDRAGNRTVQIFFYAPPEAD